MTALVTLSGVHVRRGRSDVVRGVDLTLNRGEVVAILGPNGAGKSTLLEAIGGLLPTSAGEVKRHGRVATALQAPDLAARSVRTNVELALAWWGVARSSRRTQAMTALAAMNADGLAARSARGLSGGEARRVHLARALALEPDVLLLDEPFAGLDPVSRAALLNDTGSALRSHAGGVIVVVHDRAEAWALADRLVIMIDGSVAAEGPPRDLLDQPPSPAVARFLGFVGEHHDGDDLVLTRPSQVSLDPAGSIIATITRLVPQEDGALAELSIDHGTLFAVVPYPGPGAGETVQVRLTGGVRFPAGD